MAYLLQEAKGKRDNLWYSKKDYMYKKYLFAILIINSTGCLKAGPSILNGQINEIDSAQLQRFKYQQAVIPEYETSGAVIISPRLFGLIDIGKFLTEISQSGVTTILIPDPIHDEIAKKRLNNLTEFLRSNVFETQFTKKPIFKTLPFPTNQHTTSTWVRDYGPIITKTKNMPQKLVVADFNYHDDRHGDDIFNSEFAKQNHLSRFRLPMHFQGGNFISLKKDDEIHCLMSGVVVSDNLSGLHESDKIYSEFELISDFESYLGCQKTHILPRMPFEPTGHIDMWAKAFPNGVIVVADLSADSASLSNDPIKASFIEKFLAERSKKLEELGYTVKKVPLPTPIFKVKGGDHDTIIRSYVNALILNKHIYVPRYDALPCDTRVKSTNYPDHAQTKSYETKVSEVYQSLGYTVHWIASDKLIALGGAIHCATMQLPPMTLTGPNL